MAGLQTVAMSGSDTITVNGRVLANLADQNVGELTFPNNIANVKTGKNGNSIYSFNATGAQCDFKIRVIRGSDDDKYLNNLLTQQNANFAGFILMNGEFVKQIGDGRSNIIYDTYVLSGGVFEKNIEAKSNVEGDTDQSVAVYMIKFTNAPRQET